MSFQSLADLVVLLHFAFMLFAVGGGLLAFVWPRIVWLHAPAACWGALVELAGWTCPLTPLENRLRSAAGAADFGESFVEHYLVPVVYPAALTHELQWFLGSSVILVNALVYWWVWHRSARKVDRPAEPAPVKR
jgi:hypothetical protein